MIYAIYRIHYGLDFLEKSINSIYDQVDQIFVFWSKQPWYKECKNLPPLNENVKEFCKKYDDWGDNKVTVFEREYDLPDNQFKKMYDEPDLKLRYSPEKSSIQNIWYNLYDDKNSWHKTHTHPTSTFSGIYLLHLSGENGTTFYQFGHPMYELEYDTKHIEEGNVIIFPSAIPHSIV